MNILFFPNDEQRGYNYSYEKKQFSVHYNKLKGNKYEGIVWAIKKMTVPIITNRFNEILCTDYPQLSKKDIKLKIRMLEGKWGICYSTRNSKIYTITINIMLIHYEPKYLNYIIHHEINHIIEPNHSFKFWDNVKKFVPDYEKLKHELNEYLFYRGYNLY